jgi:hypothetical protein
MLIGLNPLRAEVNKAGRLKGCALDSAPDAIPRLHQHHLSPGFQQIPSGGQPSKASANNHCFYLLHGGVLHASPRS